MNGVLVVITVPQDYGLRPVNMNINLNIPFIHRRISISMEWFRYGVILAVVLISTVVAYWGSRTLLIGLLALLVGIAGLLTLLRYPNLGFILLFMAGMFIPFAGPGGFNASILLVIMMVIFWLMDMFIVKRRFSFVRSRPIRPAFFMLLISILAFVLGQIPWFTFANQAPLTAQIGGFSIYFFLVLFMIMTANIITDIKWLKWIVWAFIGLGFFYVACKTLNLSFVDKLYQHGVYANSMFWTWLIVLPLGQAIFNKRLDLRNRVLMYVIVALTFYIAFGKQNDWKSGWVPGAVAAAALVALRFKKLIPFTIPFVAIVVVYLAQDLISTDEYSWGTRLDAWLVVLQISRISPLAGLGFANYYWYAPLFPIRGYFIRFNSHSQFIDLIAQTGILGLACFSWILYEVGRLAWNMMEQLPDGFAKGYSYSIFAGVLGSVMAAFLVDWILPFTYNIGLDGVRASILPWLFFGGLISIEQIYFAKQDTRPVAL